MRIVEIATDRADASRVLVDLGLGPAAHRHLGP